MYFSAMLATFNIGMNSLATEVIYEHKLGQAEQNLKKKTKTLHQHDHAD